MKNIFYIFILLTLIGCYSANDAFINKNTVITDESPLLDDYSNYNSTQESTVIRNNYQYQTQMENIKVIQGDSTYSLDNFLKINKNKELERFNIINDSIFILEKH